MRKRVEVLKGKIEGLDVGFHGEDREKWYKLRAFLMAALNSVQRIEVGKRKEIRELFLTLWPSKMNIEQWNLWNDVQQELQVKGIIY